MWRRINNTMIWYIERLQRSKKTQTQYNNNIMITLHPKRQLFDAENVASYRASKLRLRNYSYYVSFLTRLFNEVLVRTVIIEN